MTFGVINLEKIWHQ